MSATTMQADTLNPAELPLRDIHLPEPVSWWPPAPGWWLLLAIMMIAAALAAWLWWRHRQRRVLRELQHALQAIEQQHAQHHDADATLQQLSVLLRRAALSFRPRREVAALTGKAWLAWLDNASQSHAFTSGVGALLTEAPYQPAGHNAHAASLDEQQIQALLQLVRSTLEKLWRSRP